MTCKNPFNGTEGVRITKETAEKYRLAGLAVRRQLAKQREVWESPADLDPEQKKFFEMFGFKGKKALLIDNKYKLIYPGLKAAYEKKQFDRIAKFFEMVGVTWASDAAQFMAAYSATINNDEAPAEQKPVEVIIKRFGSDGD